MHTLSILLKLSLGLGFLLMASCSATQKGSVQASAIPLLHFQKTPCLGTCPSYEATFLEDGSVRYIGYSHVPVIDTVTFTLTAQQLNELQQGIAQVDISSLRDTYLTNWSDMPATITAFYKSGKEAKRVKQEEGGPKALLDLQDGVHGLLMSLAEAEAKKRLPIR
ncbi:DUF6438 domain-containing protein [Pontibacter ramchanderi]|uniref:DUF6438 domain-containing protein n=1 Tax=Pontibacter ramchanderi TaxID=1179743 RepID=A0A2N3U6P7_9BACT|nr:DUF6438 domain-containing protein [Pontibacter ramchanderi]PKV62414.1 hypothetical protein BD749_3826 [Pontibacter ramchanderi]